MTRHKKKSPQEMTTDEAIHELFPDAVVEEAKRELDAQEPHDSDKKADTNDTAKRHPKS